MSVTVKLAIVGGIEGRVQVCGEQCWPREILRPSFYSFLRVARKRNNTRRVLDMFALPARTMAAAASFEPVKSFYFNSRYGAKRGDPGICDFTFGNPHEFPLPNLVRAIHKHVDPQHKDWFAYKTSEGEPCSFLAARLGEELNLPFEAEDFAMTAGAFGAIALAFRLVLSAGDECVIPVPGWFCYESTLLMADAVAVRARLSPERFDLDLEAIDAAISPRTGMVIVNSPHNPTGRIYSRNELEALADLLERASARINRRIFLLSDEPYRRIRFDDIGFTSPAAVYPWTLIDYSYGKVLLAPGQRLGYLAISPLMPDAERNMLRGALFGAQMALGWTFPNAVMQYAVADLDAVSIDMDALTRKRDRILTELEPLGYEFAPPEGTFYLFGMAPGGDDEKFFNALADRDVFVMPGRILETPGYFRLCLTANDDMIERSLPAFREAAKV
jgi:aspartate aminotransferase